MSLIPSFQLYDDLVKETESWTIPSTIDLVRDIAELPAEHMNVIQALIFHHARLTNESTIHSAITKKTKKFIPYQGVIFDGGKGVTFQMKNLPERLQAIIACYLVHLFK